MESLQDNEARIEEVWEGLVRRDPQLGGAQVLALRDWLGELFHPVEPGAASSKQRGEPSFERLRGEARALRQAVFQVLEGDGPLGQARRDRVIELVEQVKDAAQHRLIELKARQEALEREYIELLERSSSGSWERAEEAVDRFLTSWRSWSEAQHVRLTIFRNRTLWFSRESGSDGFPGALERAEMLTYGEMDLVLDRPSGDGVVLGLRFRSRGACAGALVTHWPKGVFSFDSLGLSLAEQWGQRLGLFLDLIDTFHSAVEERRLLQEEAKIRENFVSKLTHDLRLPITAARAAAELMSRRDGAMLSRQGLDRIIRNLDRTERMVRDLLDVQSIRAGARLPLRREECDLAAIAQTVAQEFQALAGDRIRLEGEPPLVGYWNPDGLRRVLENLVSNAINHGDPRAEIVIRFRGVGREALLEVVNHGNPLAPEDVSRLFQPFFRSEKSSLQTLVPGWGIGLSLVRGMVEAHGGQVEVRSNLDEGTVFSVHLPLDQGARVVPLTFRLDRKFGAEGETARDSVDQASWESFPASDPPAW